MSAEILIVDDEPMNIMILREILLNNGFESNTAADGNKALKMVRDRCSLVKNEEGDQKTTTMI